MTKRLLLAGALAATLGVGQLPAQLRVPEVPNQGKPNTNKTVKGQQARTLPPQPDLSMRELRAKLQDVDSEIVRFRRQVEDAVTDDGLDMEHAGLLTAAASRVQELVTRSRDTLNSTQALIRADSASALSPAERRDALVPVEEAQAMAWRTLAEYPMLPYLRRTLERTYTFLSEARAIFP